MLKINQLIQKQNTAQFVLNIVPKKNSNIDPFNYKPLEMQTKTQTMLTKTLQDSAIDKLTTKNCKPGIVRKLIFLISSLESTKLKVHESLFFFKLKINFSQIRQT